MGGKTHEVDLAAGMDNEAADHEALSINKNQPSDLPVAQTPPVVQASVSSPKV